MNILAAAEQIAGNRWYAQEFAEAREQPVRCAGVYGFGQPGLVARCVEPALTRCEGCDQPFCVGCLLPRGLCIECEMDYGPGGA